MTPGLPGRPVVGSEPVNDKSDLCAAAQAHRARQVATDYDTSSTVRSTGEQPGEFSVFYMLRGTDTSSRLDDRLLEFNYDSSGPNTTLAIQQFDETENEWLRVGSLSEEGPYLFQQGVVEATVDAALPSFGEFAVNLDALASIFPEDECAAFSAGSVVTRTGGENGSGELQDFVGFDPTPITNCAAVRVTKDASPADLDPAAAFGNELADDINTYTGTLTVRWRDRAAHRRRGFARLHAGGDLRRPDLGEHPHRVPVV
ncbi:MAG: hypothetical protein R2697_18575 [Ilumatobacteraceae bacterium]